VNWRDIKPVDVLKWAFVALVVVVEVAVVAAIVLAFVTAYTS